MKLSVEMRNLLLAMNLGHSTAHPLAGWNILMILYQDGTASHDPLTRHYLVRLYNQNYRELDRDESMMTEPTIEPLLRMLTDQAQLIEASNRKVRERWQSGKLRTKDTTVYHISSRGIEYVRMVNRVIEAENTVVANTERIDEYCDLVVTLSDGQRVTTTTTLYNHFDRLLTTYDDVMKGMRKLDVDLHDLATDLAFNHGSEAAQHLKQMLDDTALPAYNKLLDQAPRIQALAKDTAFAGDVARSRQGKGNIDAAQAIQDTSVMTTQRMQTQQYATRQLRRLANSFAPTATEMQNSFDSIYLVFQTLMGAIELLGREMDHREQQSVDLVALTADLDDLLAHYQQVKIPVALPKHLPMDRHQNELLATIKSDDLTADERAAQLAQLADEERRDLLAAGSLPPITRQVSSREATMVTEADNPEEAADDEYVSDTENALAELVALTMPDSHTVVIDHDLTFKTTAARDAVTTLFPALYYDRLTEFNLFGRPIQTIETIQTPQPIKLAVNGESYAVTLPTGFRAQVG